MAKKSTSVSDLMAKKNPNALRQGIQSIDILAEATEAQNRAKNPCGKDDENSLPDSATEKVAVQIQEPSRREVAPALPLEPATKNEREKRSEKERRKPTVFTEEAIEAVLTHNKRETKRYSFEIYKDQEKDIQRVCDLYTQTTGKKLSASRLIRDVLDTFLSDALQQLEKKKE